MSGKAYEVTLEFARASEAGDAFGFHFGKQKYLLRREGGTYEEARFDWSQEVQEELSALAQPNAGKGAVHRWVERLKSFMSAAGWEVEQERVKQALREGREVYLTFRSAAAELYALPLELLPLESGQPISRVPGVCLRYEWPAVPSAVPQPNPPPSGGRLLFAWSAAGGAIPMAEHLEALKSACQRGEYDFDETRDVLGHVSLSGLARALEETEEPIAALHILCHGTKSETGTYGLLWNSERGGDGGTFVDPADLRHAVGQHAGRLRMVVLCACESGNAAPDNRLGSVAQALHRAGVTAVVASRLPLTTGGSTKLAQVLYRQLLEGLASVPHALREARIQLAQDASQLDWASVQLYARAEDGAELRPFVFRPYRGLLPFKAKHRRFLFGREKLQEILRRRVIEAGEGKQPRFQVVAGASGTGKSSLVMAGLIPALSTNEWDTIVMRPAEAGVGQTMVPELGRSESLAILWGTLHKVAFSDADAWPVMSTLAEVMEEARRVRQARPGRSLLLVVDQFEEVFTRLGPAERQPFIRALWELSRSKELSVVVVPTMRVDYFGRCGEVVLDDGRESRLDSIVFNDAYRLFVPQLQPLELRAVIEGPARLLGLEFEDGLSEQLGQDVGQEPGALPLLEYALDLLWQRRKGHQLTHEAYENIGGVTGALTKTVDALYDGLTPEEQKQARRLLVALVDFRDDTAPYTRRRVLLTEIRPAGGESQTAFDGVLEKFVRGRLVVQGGETEAVSARVWLEIAHEALIRQWKRLGEWVREDAERVRTLREVHSLAMVWQAHLEDADGGDAYLPRDNHLAQLEHIESQYHSELSDISHTFITKARRQDSRNVGVLSVVFLSLILPTVIFGVSLAVFQEVDSIIYSTRPGRAFKMACAIMGSLKERRAFSGDRLGNASMEFSRLVDDFYFREDAEAALIDRAMIHVAAGYLQEHAYSGASANEYEVALEVVSQSNTCDANKLRIVVHKQIGDLALGKGDLVGAKAEYSKSLSLKEWVELCCDGNGEQREDRADCSVARLVPAAAIDKFVEHRLELLRNRHTDVSRVGAVMVPHGETVRNAIAYGGDLTVEGLIEGDAIALGGSVRIQGHGRVQGDIVAFGDSVSLSEHAEVDGDVFSFGSGAHSEANAKINGKLISLGSWRRKVIDSPYGELWLSASSAKPSEPKPWFRGVAKLIFSYALLLGVSALLLTFAPTRLRVISHELWAAPVRCMGWGIGSLIGIAVVLALFFIPSSVLRYKAENTAVGLAMIGFVVALLMSGVALGGVAMTVTATATAIGNRLPRLPGMTAPWLVLAMGLLPISCLNVIPDHNIGWCLFFLFSLGVTVRTRFGARAPRNRAAPAKLLP